MPLYARDGGVWKLGGMPVRDGGVWKDPAQAYVKDNGVRKPVFAAGDSLLAVAHQSSPYVTIYNTSNWAKITNPSTLPTNTGRGVAFSPDGSLMAVAHQSSPYV